MGLGGFDLAAARRHVGSILGRFRVGRDQVWVGFMVWFWGLGVGIWCLGLGFRVWGLGLWVWGTFRYILIWHFWV